MYFLWYLLIGLVAGCIAGLIVRGHGAGFFVNLVVGLVGGLLGGWIVSLFGWIPAGTAATLWTSILGAVILLLIVSLFTRRKPATH
ncbi:MAG: GlsB/YeaQ/YmgE family stress response membrane protein [Alistipes sp.]|nr:GlsB/YeaQ/YmgE family stress response membrane protein [Alistipes sp.]